MHEFAIFDRILGIVRKTTSPRRDGRLKLPEEKLNLFQRKATGLNVKNKRLKSYFEDKLKLRIDLDACFMRLMHRSYRGIFSTMIIILK